ncbi:hypothetical protein FNW02_28790 [Komarekiella sp. 'clone 1']|uniref:Uncharacterized protein n=1 Tax=Komarekiella delphini-convector SJRDD-AB1 TaxID=2593771 RepID=A0AA40VU07_9NOST|nr:hypothetical protein [Komarekiella delphini-convector]MBD6619707.1 hypothetical protein [Komarekiella delphini-convector SJRDD-AB1]
MKQSADYYRKAFELISGTLTNRRWRQIKRELESSGVVLNLQSVQCYARLKVSYPRTVLTNSAVRTFENFQTKYQDTQEFTGNQLLSILRELKPNVSERMLLNAFYKARIQFCKHNVYSYLEASQVVFFTTITRNKNV